MTGFLPVTPVAVGPDVYRRWYKLKRWRSIAKAQLDREPLCRMCRALDPPRLTRARIADHVVPHRGDPRSFWEGELQSLCTTHHSRHKQQIETKGYSEEIGADGLPLDPNHPFNR